MADARGHKVMTQPITLIFRHLQEKQRLSIWLYENKNMRVEGVLSGFDEYMNLVLDEAAEVDMRTGTKREVGMILLKGDTITLIQVAEGGAQ